MRSFEEWLEATEIEPTHEERTPMEIAYNAGLREGIEPVADVLCNNGLSDAVFTEEYGVLSLRTPEGWLLWHSCKVDGITLTEILNKAEENLKKLKETQDR